MIWCGDKNMAAIVKFCRGVMTDLTTPNPSHHGTKIFWTDFRTLPSGGGPDGLSSIRKSSKPLLLVKGGLSPTKPGSAAQRNALPRNPIAGIMPGSCLSP